MCKFQSYSIACRIKLSLSTFQMKMINNNNLHTFACLVASFLQFRRRPTYELQPRFYFDSKVGFPRPQKYIEIDRTHPNPPRQIRCLCSVGNGSVVLGVRSALELKRHIHWELWFVHNECIIQPFTATIINCVCVPFVYILSTLKWFFFSTTKEQKRNAHWFVFRWSWAMHYQIYRFPSTYRSWI